jgi:hypothetical protein
MALKFRRGSTADKSGSLAFGEPYVNTSLGTLQVGGNSGDLTLATIGESSAANFLSVSASTFVSASTLHITSNAEIKGNLVLGGNITIGDQTTDTVAVNANLSSSIIPSLTNTFDLGSETNAWRDLYISTGSIKIVNPGTNTVVGTLTSNASGDFKVSGQLSGSSVAGLGNAQQYSASVNSRLDSIQTTTASLLGRVNSLEVKSGSLEQSFHTYSASLNTYTQSNNTTNNTQNSRLNSIESATASLNTYTASNDSTNAGQDARLSSLETTSGSLLTFSSSVANAIQFTGSNVTIKGDFLVKGTTTSINSTTVDIGDNIISLNGTGATNGGLIVRDATGGTTTSGSLLWDTTNDYWKAGAAGNEDKILLAQEFYTFTASNAGTHNNHSGRLDSLETTSASINSFTASQLTTQNEQNVRLNTIETTTGSLNTFTSSTAPRLTSLENASASIRNDFNLFTSSTAGVHANQYLILSSLENSTASLNSYSASNNTNISAIHTSTASLNSYTASNSSNVNAIHTSTASLNTFTSSINTTIKNKLNADGVISGSSQILTGTTIHSGSFFNGIPVVSGSSQITISDTTGYTTYSASVATLNDSTNTSLSSSISASISLLSQSIATSTNTLSASIAVTDLSQNNRLDSIELISGSFARTNSANTFNGNQIISGNLTITQNLIVQGSSSIQNITSSNLTLGSAFVTLNTATPVSRFAGLQIIDSGSSGGSGSFLYDAVQDEFIFVHRGNETNITSSHFIMGPETYDNLGNESYLTNNRIPKGKGNEHLNDSNITDTGTLITLGSNTSVQGTLVATGTALVSGSSQIDHNSTTNYDANRHIDHTAVSITAGNGLSGGGTIASTRTLTLDTASVHFLDGVKKELNTEGVISGSAQITTLPSIDTDDVVEGVTNRYYLDSRVKTKLNTDGVISGSSQVSHDSTTGYSANRHIDHTAVSITAGSGLTGGGDISSTRTISIATGGVTNDMLAGSIANAKLTNSAITIAGTSVSLGSSISLATILSTSGMVSGSSQISHDSTTGYVANRHIDHTAVSISAGSGLSGGGDISTTRTLSIATGGVTNDMLAGSIANAKLTNSTISGISLGSNLATLTIGTGLSGTSYNGSTGVTIANTGVTSNVAGTGISVSGATGAVTITNTGVTSAVAGTGVGVSAGTGAVTISIGQAVATSSNVQFNSLGVGMAASATTGRIDATNDIVAYSSSDKRFKDNIKPIENPLEKISKISGNTFDWKEENKIEHGYEGNDVGVIAQEIEAVLPQLVQTRESGYKAVKYDKLVALLIEGIKEQQIQINDMKVEIENLKRQKGL